MTTVSTTPRPRIRHPAGARRRGDGHAEDRPVQPRGSGCGRLPELPGAVPAQRPAAQPAALRQVVPRRHADVPAVVRARRVRLGRHAHQRREPAGVQGADARHAAEEGRTSSSPSRSSRSAACPSRRISIVDMEPFFDAFRAVKPFLITSGNPPTKERIQSQTDRARYDDTTKCILCACCTTSCPVFWNEGSLLRARGDRQRTPVHLRQPRRGRRRAARHPQRGRRRVALPHHVQLHRVLPARHPGDQGDPRGQARADVRPLTPRHSRSAATAVSAGARSHAQGCHTSAGCLVRWT